MEHAVKFAPGFEDVIEGLLCPFDGPAYLGGKDLQGERFTSATDFCLDLFGSKPVLWHHGADPDIGIEPLGRVKSLDKRDAGLWLRAQLDRSHRYWEAIKQLIERGAAGLSSGSVPHLVQIGKGGLISAWPIVEASLTVEPAHPWATVAFDPAKAVPSLKALAALQRDAEPGSKAPQPASLLLARPTERAEPTEPPRFHYRFAAPWQVPGDVRALAERAATRASEVLGIHFPLDIRWVTRSGASKAQFTLTEPLLAWTPNRGKSAWFALDAAVPGYRVAEAVAHEAHHIHSRWNDREPSEPAATRWARDFADKWLRGVIG